MFDFKNITNFSGLQIKLASQISSLGPMGK